MKKIFILLTMALSVRAYAQKLTQYSCDVFENGEPSGKKYVDRTITQWLGTMTPITHSSEVRELEPEVIGCLRAMLKAAGKM